MLKNRLYNYLSRFVFPNKGITHVKRSPKLIVSLTSWPGRINVVSQAIESILKQSLKPDMVILWLAESQFPKKERQLPQDLLRLKKGGLEIKWCERDIRSYKKLIPALLEYPDEIIVTADDDIVYSENWLEALYVSYLQCPDQIHGHHAYICSNCWSKLKNIGVRKGVGILRPFEVFGTGGGVLFPPHSLHSDVTNVELFWKLAPTNDDFWFWAMAKINDTKCRLVDGYMENIVCDEDTQIVGLDNTDNANGAGSVQLMNIIYHYPLLRGLIKQSND